MKRITPYFFISFLLLNSASIAHAGTRLPDGRIAMGVNISGNDDYNSEIHFADLMMQSRQWVNTSKGWATISTATFAADANGYPTQVPSGSITSFTTLMGDNGGHEPSGAYTLILKGSGKVSLGASAGGTYTAPGVYTININFASSGSEVILTIEQSNAGNPISQINLVMPGYYPACKGYDPANPTSCIYTPFANDLKGMSVLRFMDAMRAFGPAQTVNDLIPPTYYTQASAVGMAPELVAAICNAVNADAWVSLPQMVNDAWITLFAQRMNAVLNPTLKVYVEYFDEIWANNNWIGAQGQAMGLSCAGTSDPNGCGYQVYRSAQMWQIFQTAFGGLSRVERVAGGWFANSWENDGIMTGFKNAALKPAGNTEVPDVLAVGAYFAPGDLNALAYSSSTVADAEAAALKSINGGYKQEMVGIPGNIYATGNAAVSKKYGVRLVAYEAGQSFVVPFGNLFSNTALKNLMVAANRDQGIYSLYQQMFSTWYDNGGELFIHYNYVGGYGDSGSWGAKESISETAAQAPKWRAIEDEIAGINSGNKPPLVTLTSPANGTKYPTSPTTVPFNVTVVDTATITKVEFYNGSTLLATDVVAPYTYSWMDVALGTYTVSAKAYDSNGLSSVSLASDITVGAVTIPPGSGGTSIVNLSNIRVYPNPWRRDKYSGRPITFAQMPSGSDVKIFTISGHKIKELNGSTGSVMWGLTTDSGDRVASGLYVYLIKDSQGNQTRGKVAVIQ